MTDMTRAVILAVDDRKENLLVLENVLDDLGVDVLTAQSGNDALALMFDHEFAVVLMDVQMPGMDGFETVELMRSSKRTRHVPVIYITAISKESHFVFKGYETGAVDYVFKPIEPAILRSKVRVFVELDQLRRELKQRNAQLEQLSRELAQAAMTDPLTGLHNRRFLHEHITKDAQLVRRAYHGLEHKLSPDPKNRDLGFLLIDIDKFKIVNDKHGHDAGDAILVQFAAALNEYVRGSDIVIRWGGEEFLVLLRQTNRAESNRITDRLRRLIEGHKFKLPDGNVCPITCSIGYCVYPMGRPDDFTWEQAVNLADAAMLYAKRSGRNRVIGIELSAEVLDHESQQLILAQPDDAIQAGLLRRVQVPAGDPEPSEPSSRNPG